MRRKVIHVVSLVLVLGLSVCPALGGILLVQDDFSGSSVDTSKWQVICGPDVRVTQGDGQVSFDRPVTQLDYLATAKQFDPAVTPLVITGSVTLGPDGDMDIWTRANIIANAGGGPKHVLDSGIRVNLWTDAVDQGWPPHLDILEKSPAVWPWNSAISDGGLITVDDEVSDWTFVVTDDGAKITATFMQTGNPANKVTLTGASTTDFATDYVAVTVVNGRLNDLTIVATPPDPLLQDSFDGAALDLSKWQAVNGPDVSITQGDGKVSFNRPATQLNYLATAKQYDPAVTPLVITGSVTLGPDADMDVWTRADLVANAGGGPGHVLDSGVRINFWADAVDQGWPPNLDILKKTPGVWPWDSSISGGADIAGDDEALDWSFVITDDGTTITATFTQTSDPANTLTLTGTCTTDFAKDYVAITVTNGALNDVTIVTKPANALVYDSFDGDALDAGKWQAVNGPNVNVTQAGGQVYFSRPVAELNYLATAGQFDPAAMPLVITGSVTLGSDGDMDVWTRTSLVGNTGGGPGHVLDSGVRTNLWTDAVDQGWPPILVSAEKTAGVWPWNSAISCGANIPGDDEVSDWTFVITDNGISVTATFIQTSDPANILTSIATCATDFAADYIAFTVVNGYLNDVAIMTSKPQASFTDDFEAPHDYMTEGLGAYSGKLNGTITKLDAGITRPGALYMETVNAVWDPGPGPMLYVEVTGDFIATVKVVDFAGDANAIVEHNDSGIMARSPASDGGLENWVSMNYFPTWTGFIGRDTRDGARNELGQTAARWEGADTFGIAAQYPYIQLERKGNDFHFRISTDGETFLPLTDPAYAGIFDGSQTPLVVSRPDLPAKLQVGLFNATYSDQVGYVAFDDFSVKTP